MSIRNEKYLFALAGALISCSASAVTYSDNFMGTSATLDWKNLGDACLTAGNGSGSIPACGNTYQNGYTYTIPANEVVPGQGALMLTPSLNSQTGAILSGFPPFPLSQGIAITFTTYTFGGDSGGLARNGADGIVFFLTDGTKNAPTKTGAEGGSMGYDCSNGNGVYDGIAYGYLGLGIDEYGNFLNTGDNGTNPQKSPTSFNGGIYNSNNPSGSIANGTNTYYTSNSGTISAGTGPQYQPERIGLRGAGNTNWSWLQSMNSSYYSGSSNASKVQTACRTGQYVSSGTSSSSNLKPITYNYNAIPGGYAVLPNSQPIANNSKSATRNPTSSTAPANIAWPITYKLTISPSGLLNFNYSYNNGAFQPVMANFNIKSANGPLPASLRFGFSAGTGGSNNVHEIACFQAAPLEANSSAGSNTVTGKVTGNTQFFLASYSADNWWGSLVADPLVISGGTLSVGTNANWDAKCTLTGGLCDSMGLDASGNPIYTVPVQSPASRNLFTSNALGAGNGVALQWANLSSTQQGVLNTNTGGVVDNQGQQRVQWLQGVRSVEQLATPTPGYLRARTYVLGDIINSSPTFVGAPVSGLFPDTYTDQLYPAATNPENQAGAQQFGTYVSSNATRLNVVYAGGNDGYIHGFEAGAYDSSGNFVTTNNDGKEVVGYMPYDVLMKKAVNLADPLYKHDYLVDASPGYSDLFYGNAWHTWLVGGVGSAGQEVYALDITNPSSVAAGSVLGDWDSNTLTHLGSTVGTPVIARMHNGQWALIFGSGLGSNGKSAGIYIGLINSSSGAVGPFQFLDTGVGTATNPDGIAYVSSVDLDGDGITDYLYAGDTQGNVWRFDVTSNSASSWNVGSSPVFVAKDSTGKTQPITTAVTVLAIQTGTVTRDMLYFGTGQQTQSTVTSATQYQKGPQTFYGIWDWDMTTWNGLSSSKYASLTGPQSVLSSALLAQSLTSASDATHRYLSNTNVVCWQGDAATTSCPSPNQYGWMFNLPDPGPATGTNAGEGEQIIYNPTFIGGAIVVNTAIPPKISAAQCNPGLQSGWTMAFNPATGGGFPQNFFADAGGGFGGGNSTVGGVKTSGVGTPTSLQYGGQSYMVTQTVTGQAKLFPYSPYSTTTASRVSWQEIVTP